MGRKPSILLKMTKHCTTFTFKEVSWWPVGKLFHSLEDLIFEYPQKAQLIRKQKRLWIISRRLLPHPLYHFTGDQPTNQLYCTARDNAHNVHVQFVLWISFLFWQHLKALSRLISKVFFERLRWKRQKQVLGRRSDVGGVGRGLDRWTPGPVASTSSSSSSS